MYRTDASANNTKRDQNLISFNDETGGKGKNYDGEESFSYFTTNLQQY